MKKLLSIALLGAASGPWLFLNSANAAPLPQSGPYNFSGTVVSASSGCPHATGTSVQGYGIYPGIDPGDPQDNIPPSFKYGQFSKGAFVIAFSDGTAIKKIGLGLKAGPTFKAPYISASGTVSVGIPNPPETLKGTWSGTFGYDLTSKFSFDIRLKVAEPSSAKCTVEYKLDFTRGIPQKFLNLL